MPLLACFPTVSDGWIWHWLNSSAAPPATVVWGGTFLQPGLAQRGCARPRPTDHAPHLFIIDHQGMPDLPGVSSLVTSGPPKSARSAVCDAQQQGAQCFDSASMQQLERTASMLGSTGQRSADAPLTARPAFSDYGSCGPCGGVNAARQRQLRVQLPGISPGQLLPRAPRPSSSTRASSSRRRKVRSCRMARTQRPSLPATPRSRANPVPTPTLTGRSLVAAITADGRGSMARGRGPAVTIAAAVASLSAARGRASSEVRLCSVCAHVPCVYMHLTAC